MTLKTHHGEMLTAQQVADYFKISVQSVRKHYSAIGGIKLGTIYRFPEKDVINGISKLQQQQRQIPVDCPGEGQREAEKEAVQDEKRSSSVGGRAAEKRKGRVISDRHDLW